MTAFQNRMKEETKNIFHSFYDQEKLRKEISLRRRLRFNTISESFLNMIICVSKTRIGAHIMILVEMIKVSFISLEEDQQ